MKTVLAIPDFYWEYRFQRDSFKLKYIEVVKNKIPEGLCYNEKEFVCEVCEKPKQPSFWERFFK